jgi:hypothetical protein
LARYSDGKQREHGQQHAFPLEAIDEHRREYPGECGAKGIGGHQQTEFVGAHAQFPHQDRAQRHHDHEVENMDELDAGQRHQQHALACGIKRFGNGWRIQGH